MNRSPHLAHLSFLCTPPHFHFESTSTCLLSFTTHRNPITKQSCVSVKYFVGIRWLKKWAFWLLWASQLFFFSPRHTVYKWPAECLVISNSPFLKGKLLATPHWKCKWSVINQPCRHLYGNEKGSQSTLYQDVVIHLLLLKFHQRAKLRN